MKKKFDEIEEDYNKHSIYISWILIIFVFFAIGLILGLVIGRVT